MASQKLITTEKLVEYLDQEAGILLLSQDVYDIGSYGWQSEDTEDPDYIGHAMWQVNPPLETEWEYLWGDGDMLNKKRTIHVWCQAASLSPICSSKSIGETYPKAA
jgi:hypothetical protein